MNGLFNFANRLRSTYNVATSLSQPSHPTFLATVQAFGEELNQKEEDAQMNLVTAESAFEEEVKAIREKMSKVQSEIVSMEGRHQLEDEQYLKSDQEYQQVNMELTGLSGQRSAAREVLYCRFIVIFRFYHSISMTQLFTHLHE